MSRVPTPIFWSLWLAAGAALAVALWLVGPYDLAVSRAVYTPDGLFGRVVLWAGPWPGIGGALAGGVWLWVTRRRPSRWRPVVWGVVALALLQPYLITPLMKFAWGRVRFYDLLPGGADFTPFWSLQGPGGGASFPSGHTASAFVWTPAPFALYDLGHRRLAVFAGTLGVAYGLAVAWGRVVFGAHYLTDVVFSAGLALLLGAVIARRLVGRHRSIPGRMIAGPTRAPSDA